jgi:hypothetical protein
MNESRTTLEFEIRVTGFNGSYTWGLGDRASFLHNSEIRIVGTVIQGKSAIGKSATIDVETLKGTEPDSHDPNWFKDTVAVGRVEIGEHALNAHAVVARSGIQFMLGLLSSGMERRLWIKCGAAKETQDSAGQFDLLRLTMFAE